MSVGYTISGSDVTAVNGDYCPIGTFVGYPGYSNPSGDYMYVRNDGLAGQIVSIDAPPFGDSAHREYYMYPDISTFPLGTWVPQGSPFATTNITLSAITCADAGSGVATGTATSTSALLGSIAFGQAILIFIGFLIVVGLFYNSVTRKKPWLS